MNMLIDTLSQVSGHPLAWASVAGVASVALISALHFLKCPYVHGRDRDRDLVTEEHAIRHLDEPFIAGAGYLFTMLAGIVAMVGGLAMISAAVEPVIAFAMLAAGICIVQIAPLRVRLHEACYRVAAAAREGPEAVAFARDRLRGIHYVNIAMSTAVAALLALALLSF